MTSFANIYHSAKSWFKSNSKFLKSADLKLLEQNKRKVSFVHEILELLIELKSSKTINDLKKRQFSMEEQHALDRVSILLHKCLEGIQWAYYHGQNPAQRVNSHTAFELYLQHLITLILTSEDLNENQKVRIKEEISQHLEKELSNAQTSSKKPSLVSEISQISEKVWPGLQQIALYQNSRALLA